MRGAVAARLGRAEEELSEAISRCLIVGTEAAADDDQRLREGGREGVAVVSSHNKGRRQSCSSRAASPLTLTSGSHAHSLLRPLPVCVVFFSPFQKIGGAFSSVSAAPPNEGRGRNAVAQHTIPASHIHSAFVHMCACPTAAVLYQPRPPLPAPGSGLGEGGERERERE